MLLQSWYVKLLALWAVLGLPGFLLGWGFAGRAPWKDLPLMFEPELFDPVSVVITLIGWAILLSPFVLAPFGISRKHD